MVNVKDGSLIVTLINNNGVTKTAREKAVIDSRKAQQVTVKYIGGLAPNSVVKDLYNNNSYTLSNKSVTLRIPPGECVVLEFTFKK